MLGSRAVVVRSLGFLWLFLLTLQARAEGLEYSQIDRAVVRVMALGLSDMEQVSHEGRNYRLASPIGGHGSGVVVDASGLILTAAHVVEGARLVAVVLPQTDQAIPAEVVFADKDRDFAFLRVNQSVPTAVSLPAEDPKLKVRSTVYAIGYPIDATRTDPQSTRGVVSGLLKDSRLQLDVPVNPGNSGGPVIDEKERLVGIVVARGDVSQGITGITIAVPNAVFRSKLNELKGSRGGAPDSERRKKLAEMTKRAAEQGGDWLRNSLEADSAESSLAGARTLLSQAKELKDSADALVLAAAYVWNWRVVREARGNGGWQVLERKVVTLCRMATKIEPHLESHSSFVAYVIGKLESEPDDPRPFDIDANDAAIVAAGAGAGAAGDVQSHGRYSLAPARSGYSSRVGVGAELMLADQGKSLAFPIDLMWGALISPALRVGALLDIAWAGMLHDDHSQDNPVFIDLGAGAEVDLFLGQAVYVGGTGLGAFGIGNNPYTGLGYRAGGVLGLNLDRSVDSQFGLLLRGTYSARGSGADARSGLEAGLLLTWNKFPMENAAWR